MSSVVRDRIARAEAAAAAGAETPPTSMSPSMPPVTPLDVLAQQTLALVECGNAILLIIRQMQQGQRAQQAAPRPPRAERAPPPTFGQKDLPAPATPADHKE